MSGRSFIATVASSCKVLGEPAVAFEQHGSASGGERRADGAAQAVAHAGEPLVGDDELAGLLEERLHRDGERAATAARNDHVVGPAQARQLHHEAEGVEVARARDVRGVFDGQQAAHVAAELDPLVDLRGRRPYEVFQHGVGVDGERQIDARVALGQLGLVDVDLRDDCERRELLPVEPGLLQDRGVPSAMTRSACCNSTLLERCPHVLGRPKYTG